MKTLLVTGGSRGIGRAVALMAAGRGWNVAINYVGNREAAEETLAAVSAQGVKAISIAGDVSKEADVVAMFKKTKGEFGGIDGVVINAGIVAQSMPLADMDGDRLKRMFEVNTLGAYLCAREAARMLPISKGGNGGAIVVMSSMAAKLGSPFNFVDYAGSKAALDTLTTGLALELAGDGVRVNAVRPGLIDTEIHADCGIPDRAEKLGAQTPMGRAGTADEVAEAVLWLLSDASSYATGTKIDVSGGR